jgi:hypothetical protein
MLAIEESFDRALSSQIDDFDALHPDTVLHLRYIHSFVTSHIAQLREVRGQSGTLGGRLGEGFRRAGMMLAGMGESAIDFVRNDTLPDQLRKNCSAASLAYAGYRMLFTTASALRAGETCRMAAEFLADYSRITLILQDLLPDAVVTQLEADGLHLEEPAVRSRNSNRIEGVPVHAG